MNRLLALTVLLALLVVLVRCSHRKGTPSMPSPASGTATQASSKGIPAPAEEPPADVVRKLAFQEYEAIEKAGGMPVTLTATGKSMVLHPKLHEARVDSCHRMPQSLPYDYECDLNLLLSLSPDGSAPSWKGERLFVTWDTVRGEWGLP